MEVIIGIDIGGTNTKYGILKKNGFILYENKVSTNKFKLLKDFINYLTIELNIELKKIKYFKLLGIGIGAPNANYYSGCIENAPNLIWKGKIELKKLFQEKFNVPIIITNDANAAALGEMHFGSAKNIKNFVMITIGTGLGSGIVSNGEVIYGHDGFAGELGHTTVVNNGRNCNCGRKGCLETYVSSRGITETYNELSLNSKFNYNKILTSEEIFNIAKNNNPIAIKTFDKTADILGYSLSNLVAITSPQIIVLYGGVAESGDLLIKPTKKYMEKYLLDIFKNKTNIVKSKLNKYNGALLGASSLVLNEIQS